MLKKRQEYPVIFILLSLGLKLIAFFNLHALNCQMECKYCRYNIRGWLTGINHPDSNPNALFSLALRYNDPTIVGTQAQYSGNNSQIGLAKSFEVNAGDVFDLEVYAKYEAFDEEGTATNLNTLITALTSAFSLNPSGGIGLEGQAAYNAFTNHFGAGSLIDPNDIEDDEPPRAFLNYLLFDEDFVLVDAGFDQVTVNAEQVGVSPNIPHDYLSLHVKVKQKGYLYVYLSNEHPVLANVYFDDFKIVHHTGIEQSDDYYAFGLTFNSFRKENTTKNNYQYNSKELQDELDLGWLDYGARMFMPEIGRWGVMDPLMEKDYSWSAYKYCYNNPMLFADPTGMAEVYGMQVEGQLIYSASALVNYQGETYKGFDSFFEANPDISAAIVTNMGNELVLNSTFTNGEKGDGQKLYSYNRHTQARREQMAQARNQGGGPSLTDILLAGIGTAGLVAESQSAIISGSRTGFTSGKLSINSPRIYSKATAVKVNIAAKGIGLGLTIWSVFNTERQFRNGEIDAGRRRYNHLNNGFGLIFPVAGLPMAVGDYLGQKYSNEIVNDVSQPGGFLFERMKSVLEFFGIPTGPDK